jgi:DNA-binding response OmpR family regulator
MLYNDYGDFMTKILLIEDDPTISLSITYLLNNEGFKVVSCDNIEGSKGHLNNNTYSLVLLDLSLPDGNGFDMCEYIKSNYNIPVIIVTAKDEENDIVKGFDLGTDDYISKPFRAKELISRIKNVLKRNKNTNEIISYMNIRIDTKSYCVYKDNELIELTPLEYSILLTLFNHIGQVLTREQLLSNIWDANESFVNDNTLTVYIKRLREKIECDANNPLIIKTVRGIGYKVGD